MLLLGIAFLVVTALPSAAQQNTDQSQPAQSQEKSGKPAETLKVNVNVVNLYFVTKDKHGTLVPNLGQDQFEVLENGQPQTIRYYKTDTTQPLTLGLMIDTSGSEARMLGVEQDAVGQFIDTVLRDKDLAFLMSFDVNVDLLQDLTATTQELRTAVRKTEINTGGGGGLPGLGGGPIPQATPRARCSTTPSILPRMISCGTRSGARR